MKLLFSKYIKKNFIFQLFNFLLIGRIIAKNSSGFIPKFLVEEEPLDIIKLNYDDFGPEFDVFNLSEKIGKENVLLTVSNPIFHYKNINKFINFSKFPGFINKIRIGYTNSPNAFYHSVK